MLSVGVGEDVNDLYAPEDLHPDLIPHIYSEQIFPVLKHPLVFSVPYSEIQNRLLNRSYEYKQARLVRAREEGDWHTWVFLHERPYRLDAFLEIAEEITDQRAYWKVMRTVWIDAENIHEIRSRWNTLWRLWRARGSIRTPEDEALIEQLPESFTVWRGYSVAAGKLGLSWTLDRDKAAWFAKRFAEMRHCAGRPKVVQAVCRRRAVLAHFPDRNESEIVVFPRDLKDICTG